MEFEYMAGGEAPAALQHLVRGLQRASTLSEIADLVSRTVRSLTSADGSTVVLRDGDLCHYFEEDAISELWKGKRFPAEACISGWCMRTGRSAIIPDVFADPRIPHELYRRTFVRSMAMVPVSEARSIAALGAYWAEGRSIELATVDQLVAISSIARPHLSRLNLAG